LQAEGIPAEVSWKSEQEGTPTAIELAVRKERTPPPHIALLMFAHL